MAEKIGNVWVFIEQEAGKIADVSLELVCKGRELAAQLGVKTEAVLLGDNVAGLRRHPLRLRLRQCVPRRGFAAGALHRAALCEGDHGSDPGAQAEHSSLRRDPEGARTRAARRFRKTRRTDRRLHRPADRRLRGQEEQQELHQQAHADPSGVRRQHHRDHREHLGRSADGDRPRGRDEARRTRLRPQGHCDSGRGEAH